MADGTRVPTQPEVVGMKKQVHCSDALGAFQFATVSATPYRCPTSLPTKYAHSSSCLYCCLVVFS